MTEQNSPQPPNDLQPTVANAHRRASELVSQILELTYPTAEELALDGAEGVAVNLLLRCRDLLRAIQLLALNNMLFISACLIRQVFEHSATGAWLLQAPDAYDLVVGDFAKHIKDASDRLPDEYGSQWIELQKLIEPDTDDPVRPRRLPNLAERLVGPYVDHYALYKELCGLDHAGLNSAVHAGSATREDFDTPPAWGEEQRWLAYAGCITAALSLAIRAKCGEPSASNLASLLFQLNQEQYKWGPER